MTPNDSTDLTREANCMCFRVRRASRAISQHYDAALAPHGLTAPQFSLLSVLAECGLRSLGQLAKLSTTDRTTLTRNLGLLEKRGLVESAPGVDRRTRRFRLSPAGRKLQVAAREDWRSVQAGLEERLGTDRFQRILADLEAVVESLA